MIRGSIFAAILLGTLASPALADPSGFVSIGAGVVSFDANWADDTFDGSAIEFAASGAYDFEGGLGAQGDFVFHRYGVEVYGGDSTITDFDGAVHLFFRNDQYLLGAFVQGGKSKYYYDDAYILEETRGYAGLEGQVFVDNLTLYGRIAGSNIDMDGEDDSWTGWLADAELRYFITDNFRIDVHAGTEVQNTDLKSGDIDTVKVGIGGEYKLEDSPISFFGRLDYVSTQTEIDIDQTAVRILVGAKFNFGDETLKSRDRTGASLKPVEPAPLVFEDAR